MPRPRILIILLLVASGCRGDAARIDDANELAYRVKPSVVRISAFATGEFRYPPSAIAKVESQLIADGHELRAREVGEESPVVDTGAGGSGSGFVIHPDGVILTSGHVVAPTRDQGQLARDLHRNGAIAALVRHFPVDALRTIYRGDSLDRHVEALAAAGRVENTRVVTQVELSNGETLPYTIRRYSPALDQRGTDLAILQIERRGLPSLPLGDSDATRVGDAVWSVGYPSVASSTDEVIGGWLSRESDLEATFNPGTITAIKRNIANTPVFQSNVAIYGGNSGGPAVNRNGEVIGVSTWGHTAAEQIKFLVPINVARQMLADARITPTTDGEFNRRYRSAFEAARDGQWSRVKVELALASRLFPNSPDLIRFAADADRAVASMSPWRVRPAAAAVAALVLAAAMIAVALVRPRALVAGASVPVTLVAPAGATGTGTAALGRLTVLNGVRSGEKLGLAGSGIRIGRESQVCEIVLEHPKISRLHAEVVSIDGKIVLIDRNSSNGTYVNDHKIDKRVLQNGDIIHLGGRNAVALVFHA